MLSLTQIEKEKFNEFVKTHETKSHFLQSSTWGEFCKKEKNVTPYYLGLVDSEGNIQATALLLQRKLPLNYCYFYCPRGYVLDYKNRSILKIMTEKLKIFAKEKKALYIKIDPDVKLHSLDLEGNVINGDNNEDLVEYLKSIGYKHLGFNKAFEHNQPRYTFRLELKDNIKKVEDGFHKTTKKVTSKGNIYDLEIHKNEDETIKDFYKTMIDTAQRENISQYSKEYYENFFKILHKSNMSDLYVIYLDKNKTKNIIKNKITELNKNKEKLKIDTKIQEIDNQIKKQEKLLAEIDEIKEKKYPLSAIITTKFNDKVWTIHGGNSTYLRELNSNYLIYYEIIKDAIEEGYKTIDFFGTSFNPKEDDPEYGIHLFKKRLGGEYTEFIGEFDYIINKPLYFIFNKIIPIYRNIIKNIRKKEIKNGISNTK